MTLEAISPDERKKLVCQLEEYTSVVSMTVLMHLEGDLDNASDCLGSWESEADEDDNGKSAVSNSTSAGVFNLTERKTEMIRVGPESSSAQTKLS
jgi:hypothetical protein